MERLTAAPEPIHTEEIQDIIGKPPKWIYRWGISFILIVVLIVVAISAFISYPDTIETQIKIHALSSPSPIIFKDSVQLIKLCVEPGQLVRKGDHLAYVRNKNGVIAVLSPQYGNVLYASVFHEGEQLYPSKVFFYINDFTKGYYGEMLIPQKNLSKVKKGQKVIISLKNEDPKYKPVAYVKYIIDDPLNGNISIAEVDIDPISGNSKLSGLKNGLVTNAQIITDRTTLFQRLLEVITKTKNR